MQIHNGGQNQETWFQKLVSIINMGEKRIKRVKGRVEKEEKKIRTLFHPIAEQLKPIWLAEFYQNLSLPQDKRGKKDKKKKQQSLREGKKQAGTAADLVKTEEEEKAAAE